MTVEDAVVRILLQDAGVSALVSTRVEPGFRIPTSDPMPYINVARRLEEHGQNLVDGHDGLCDSTIEITYWAKSRTDARKLAELGRLALLAEPFPRLVTVGPESFTLDELQLDSSEDLPVQLFPGSERGIEALQQAWYAPYTEVIPQATL